MTVWPHDNTDAKNAFYGNFHHGDWQEKYLTHITPPFQMYYDKKPMKSILVNKMCANELMAVFNEIWEAVGKDQKKADETGVTDFGGCFNIRAIAGSNNYSNHSWACAIDLSPGSNGFNVQKTTLHSIVVNTFKKHGARWGGDYHGRKDPMHFEFVQS